ncbi:MAG: hypothetical protein E3K37_07960 [Candidatus Kuenenia sp.]|nr:hypothetical protein [Candidatus Kuenenia hertensis]
MNFFAAKHIILGLIAFCSLCFHGCASLSNKKHLLPFDQQYTIHSMGKGWQILQEEKEGLSLWNEEYNATIVIIYSHLHNETLTPDLLNHQLFIGIRNKDVIMKESVLIDGKETLHSVLMGKLDDKKFKFDAYVIKEDIFVCDIVYFAQPEFFDSAHGDFQELIRSFKFTNTRIPSL